MPAQVPAGNLAVEGTARNVELFLRQHYVPLPDCELTRQGATSFRLIVGSAVVLVDVRPLGEGEASVVVSCSVVSGVHATDELRDYLLAENAVRPFGAFAMPSSDEVVFRHTLLGSTLNREELWRAVDSVGAVSDEDDDKIVERFGGTTSVSRLAGTAAPTGPLGLSATDLRAMLEAAGATLTDVGGDAGADDVLDPLAGMLGRRYDLVQPLLGRVRHAIQTGDGRAVCPYPAATGAPGALRPILTLLERNALIEAHDIDGPRRRVHVAVNPANIVARQFLTGGWLERFVRRTVRDYLDKHFGDVAVLRNVKGTLAGGEAFELDLLFGCSQGMLWVECKSGKFETSLPRYKWLGQRLGIPPSRRTVVAGARVDQQTRNDLQKLYQVRVVNPEDLGNYLGRLRF